jgi:hypothetical protein
LFPHLEQEAVLDVDVHRRRRGGRGNEEIAGAVEHAALAVSHEGVHFVEGVMDDLGVLGHLLDVA